MSSNPAPTGRSQPAAGSGTDEPNLLCVATVTPRKGHLILVEALAKLADLPWRLTCIGSTTRDAGATAAVQDAIARHGLTGRIALMDEIEPEALRSQYHAADLFVLPSYYEGYGMALAEALSHGLPIVSSKAGAIPTTVPADAGILVPPGDVARFDGSLAPRSDRRRSAIPPDGCRPRRRLEAADLGRRGGPVRRRAGGDRAGLAQVPCQSLRTAAGPQLGIRSAMAPASLGL